MATGQFAVPVVVPPNTTAQVWLSGSSTGLIEVGSGQWHWSVPYENREYRTIFTLDDRVGDIMSDPTSYDAVRQTLTRLGVPSFLFAVMEGERGSTLRQVLSLIGSPLPLETALITALANVARRANL